jgi:glycosyltransferase involved in cell wall biosynthesis
VSFVTADLGLGGTGKGVVSFATRLDRERFAPQVVTLSSGGPREDDLRAGDVPLVAGCGDIVALADALEGSDVVHVFRHGIADPLVPGAVARVGVPVLIESNIFGARDRSPAESQFACHLFVSMMCFMRYRRQVTPAHQFAARHRVLYFPPEADSLRQLAPNRTEACEALGLDSARPVVARIGRAQDLKWRNLLVDMIPALVRLVPDVQILLVGATPAKRDRLAGRGVLDRVQLMEPVAGDENLATLYAASDVVVNASMIGESQGLVIAEAMALGIPVVTCSTPWADNAQIEFVRSGVNGWVANHPREFAQAVADLLLNPERRAAFGDAARKEVDDRLDPAALTGQLQQLYEHHVHGGEVDWSPSADDIADFERSYPASSKVSFRRATSRERVEALMMRTQEHGLRRWAGARMVASNVARRLRPG